MTATYRRRRRFFGRLALCSGLGLVGGGLLAIPFSGSDGGSSTVTTPVSATASSPQPTTLAVPTALTSPATTVDPGTTSIAGGAAASATAASPASTSSATSTNSATAPPASLAAVTTAGVTVSTLAPPPAVEATAYAVYDMATGVPIAESNANQHLSVGSLQKLLTAYVVMQAGDPEKSVTVPRLQTGAMESAIGLLPGETYPRSLLLRAMLVVSANDAARTLALDVGGSEDVFVARMNEAAGALGLTDTVVANPVGLDADRQYSSAHDMAELAMVLMRDPTFHETVARTSATLHGITFPATNSLLRLYVGADGVKTGRTTQAGYCLAGSATRDGRQLLVVVLGAPSEAARTRAAAALLDWGFAQQP